MLALFRLWQMDRRDRAERDAALGAFKDQPDIYLLKGNMVFSCFGDLPLLSQSSYNPRYIGTN